MKIWPLKGTLYPELFCRIYSEEVIFCTFCLKREKQTHKNKYGEGKEREDDMTKMKKKNKGRRRRKRRTKEGIKHVTVLEQFLIIYQYT